MVDKIFLFSMNNSFISLFTFYSKHKHARAHTRAHLNDCGSENK